MCDAMPSTTREHGDGVDDQTAAGAIDDAGLSETVMRVTNAAMSGFYEHARQYSYVEPPRCATHLLDKGLLLEVARLEEVAGAHEQAIGLRPGDDETLEDDTGDDLATAELGRGEAVDCARDRQSDPRRADDRTHGASSWPSACARSGSGGASRWPR